MSKKPTYEELERRVKELEKEAGKRKEAEEELRKHQFIIESAHDAIFFKDLGSRYIIANDRTLEAFGLSREDVIGKNDYELMPDQKEAKKNVHDDQIVFKSGKPTEVFKHMTGAAGKEYWFQAIKVPQFDNYGKVTGLVGIARDITERKQAEAALKKSEIRYRSFVENFRGIAFRGKMDFTPVFFHGAVFEITGYTEDEFVGGNPRWDQAIHPDDLSGLFTEDEKKLRTIPWYSYEREYRIIRKDGKTRWIHEIIQNVCDESGQPSYVQGALYDITDRKQAEEALKESEGKLSAMLQSIGDHISMMDKDLNIIWANSIAKKIFGNDIIGKKCHEVYHRRKEPCEPYPCFVLKAFMDGEIHEHDTQVIDKDGKILSFHCTANVALKDKEGKPKAVIDIFRDVTEEKLAQEEKSKLGTQLQQAKKMQAIGTLASGFAHNFNNLLMGIVANTSIMLLDIDSNHPHYRYLKNIEKQVKSGSKVARQLTGYARVERYEFKPINMNQLLKETSVTFGIAKKKIRFHQKIAEKLHIIEADKEQIEQALLNLYINAVDAMPEGGDLFLKTMNVTYQDMIGRTYKPKPGKYILLTVRDTGIGMDKKTKERIFEPFFTTKDNIQSTGLGLSSTYNIIKAHGGYIDVDSEKGVGTTFSIYLPATKKEIKEKKEPSVEILKGKETILLEIQD